MQIKVFEDIIAWQKSKEFIVNVYSVFAESKDFGFNNRIQMERRTTIFLKNYSLVILLFLFSMHLSAQKVKIENGTSITITANYLQVTDDFNATTNNIGIGTTSPSYTLHVNGSVAGTSSYNNLSDARLKKDVVAYENGIDKVMQLRPVTFNWKQEDYPNMNLDSRNHVGFIAQEVEEVVPQVVSTANDEMQTKSIAYSDLVPVLTKAIQEQQQEIEQLKHALSQKDQAFEGLKAELENLKKLVHSNLSQLTINQ